MGVDCSIFAKGKKQMRFLSRAYCFNNYNTEKMFKFGHYLTREEMTQALNEIKKHHAESLDMAKRKLESVESALAFVDKIKDESYFMIQQDNAPDYDCDEFTNVED